MEYKKYSVEEHETCKQTILKKRKEDIAELVPYLIIFAIIIAIYLLALLTYYKSSFDFTLFSFFIGLGSWSWFYSDSQKILNQNLFSLYGIIGLFIFVLNIILKVITDSNFYNCLTAGFSLFYIICFRLLTNLFFKDFAQLHIKPTILFAQKWRKWSHENTNHEYIVTKKELMFSNLLFFGPWLLGSAIFYIVIKL
ncbi:hypothetical protein [Flavobacterium branchiicola]|uniref:DUF1295 domain-containing protein n=1 Tax=Flavobacterium branchiicola TaxID=1114875 RepID=A0ABV9P8D6_9FLAO|nr:hypothetical protein [Flavobacterium branchiicola]MBS7253678.1 hypothetical protein [Flavobacterium branchiicola]